ncbi:hypothetical protein BXZ70DRAFT_895787 [Cristinia sonorae]|uniref:Amine oxidase domain-containing protein n=1 Tax=Cristinia sonorae TaxID=1940300 RepID=A0A8K0XNB2_9AGAR|nr:hypothetical protein BXZ70DRAFT_895787 [Cristinia sonorae]
MTLEKINSSLKNANLPLIEYEILEAESADGHPIGGRLWTHKFSNSKNDYYDRGAMRFPDTPPMQPVMRLFRELKLENVMIPYIPTIDDNINFFNNNIKTNTQVAAAADMGEFDPFRTWTRGLTGTAKDMYYAQIGPFRKALVENFEKGWRMLMKYDAYSTRGFMTIKGSDGVGTYSTKVVDYLETFGAGSGMYDQALSEAVLQSLDFDYPDDVNWWTIQGGSAVIAEAMAKNIDTTRIHNGKRVTGLWPAIKWTFPLGTGVISLNPFPPTMPIVKGVVSSIPWGAFRMVDTSWCNLSWDFQTAARCLNYDPSTKVGIKFKERWWETLDPPQKGDVSNTDRPTRVVVYPSYGIDGTDATILVSYTWAQDALRVGSFAGNEEKEKIMLKVILKDLADMRGMDEDDLSELLVSYDIWPWYSYENAVGAFAYFGPGQFSTIFTNSTKPAVMGRLHFAGEATSVWNGCV